MEQYWLKYTHDNLDDSGYMWAPSPPPPPPSSSSSSSPVYKPNSVLNAPLILRTGPLGGYYNKPHLYMKTLRQEILAFPGNRANKTNLIWTKVV